MLPNHLCNMQHQKTTRYEGLPNALLSDEKVQYLAIANVVGEIVEIFDSKVRQNNNLLSKEKLSNYLHKISFSTSMLTFENIQFMVLDTNGTKTMIVNLEEDTVIIGMNEDAGLSDVANIFRLICQEISFS